VSIRACGRSTSSGLLPVLKVYVKLYALLRKHHPGPKRSVPLEVELPAGAVVADLVPALGLPEKLVRRAFVNNQVRGLDEALEDGDQVGLFPPVVGGASMLRIACYNPITVGKGLTSTAVGPRQPGPCVDGSAPIA
jgi:sulfur-carrier protein